MWACDGVSSTPRSGGEVSRAPARDGGGASWRKKFNHVGPRQKRRSPLFRLYREIAAQRGQDAFADRGALFQDLAVPESAGSSSPSIE